MQAIMIDVLVFMINNAERRDNQCQKNTTAVVEQLQDVAMQISELDDSYHPHGIRIL